MNKIPERQFNRALVRTPGRSVISGLTTANLGQPDYSLIVKQHQAYINALESCGVKPMVLSPLESYPDSTFVEDTAILTQNGAIITQPGAVSRRDEIQFIQPILKTWFKTVERIRAPGRLDAGDVVEAGNRFFIGISKRTNAEGARQCTNILKRFGYTAKTLNVHSGIHLKSGVGYLAKNTLVLSADYADEPAFKSYKRLVLPKGESYAANCVYLNGTVLIPSGFPGVKSVLESAGFSTRSLDMTEFRKLDGGLSCLSLRFTIPEK